jgi:CopA family copper-resistance protein
VVHQGTEFNLTIGETPVNFTGRARSAITVNGSLPAPVLRWREGDTVTLRVRNTLAQDSSIHWHGILLPANMDGVPGLSFHGIPARGAWQYRFPVRQSGTYWYHSHSMLQEQAGLYGALIVDPRGPDPIAAARDHVVLLSDWSDEAPHALFARLRKQSDYYNREQRTAGDLLSDARTLGLAATLAERSAWGAMRMNPTDLADVGGATYTYLLNGTAPAGNWTGLFAPGERVRLRFINGSAMSYFDVRIPGLAMTVVAADGQLVHPVTVDELRIALAETFDVIVEPGGQDAYTIFAQAMDRSGYARGTLAVREGLEAPVPALDRRSILTMADMGHAHGEGVTPVGVASNVHAAHGAASTSDHSAHGAGAPVANVVHPASEYGNPGVDMQAVVVAARLGDPGIGLREAQLRAHRSGWTAGHRVLRYSDLQTVFEDPDGRSPGREIELHLTGHMERFVWSFDGVRFADAEPLRFRYGERLRIVLVNDTMMTHPIHLHGMWSDLEDEAGGFMLRKHTVDMPPGTRRSYRVTADALGRWAYHCHLLYHMEAGMFREVRVEE